MEMNKDEKQHLKAEEKGSRNETDKERKSEAANIPEENPMIRKRWFGRGIYGSKDVPIRLLDGLIFFVFIAIVGTIIFSTMHGGFYIRFDSMGGSAVEEQKKKYGDFLDEPEEPHRAGYDFAGWYIKDTETGWNFALDTVSGDLTLTARWSPAEILVKFDLNGGTLPDSEISALASAETAPEAEAANTEAVQTETGKAKAETAEKTVIYGEAYGELPVPVRAGFHFAGWEYSGSMITADSKVETNGEHVLTAKWEA